MKSFKTLSKKSNNDFYNLKQKYVNSTKSFKNTPIKKKSIFNHFEDFDNFLNSKNIILNSNYFSEKKQKKNPLKKNNFENSKKNNLKLLSSTNAHNEAIKKIEFVNNFIITLSDDFSIKTWKIPFINSEKNKNRNLNKILQNNIKKNSFSNLRKVSNSNISLNLNKNLNKKINQKIKKNSNKNISQNLRKNLNKHLIKNNINSISNNLKKNLNLGKNLKNIYRSNINKTNISLSIKNKQTIREIKNPIINSCSYKDNFFVSDYNCFLHVFELDKKKNIFSKKKIFINNGKINFLDAYKNSILVSSNDYVKLFKIDQKENKEKIKFETLASEKFGKIQFYNKNKFYVHSKEKKTNRFISYDIKKEKQNSIIFQNKKSNYFKISKKLNLLISSNKNNTITIYDIRTNKLIRNLNPKVDFLNLIDINEEENIFLSSGGNFLKIWDLRNFKFYDQYNFFNSKDGEGILDAKFWVDNQIVTASDDGNFQVFNY